MKIRLFVISRNGTAIITSEGGDGALYTHTGAPNMVGGDLVLRASRMTSIEANERIERARLRCAPLLGKWDAERASDGTLECGLAQYGFRAAAALGGEFGQVTESGDVAWDRSPETIRVAFAHREHRQRGQGLAQIEHVMAHLLGEVRQ